ncbi:hypothetical protein QVD17_38074 [Tagetes erecta]|uniref:Uncharacterized protein n=1 Tax=Tagetes erecta TaxID=13708 RepID=A0AAD8JXH4_TARER|nr:hypothetical protein QVD17_38074 [Tagetes erecta]
MESTHIEFSKDLNRCLPSNSFHPVDGEKRYAIEKSASALRHLVDFIRELNCRKMEEKGGEHSLMKGANTHIRIRPILIEPQALLRYGQELKLANIRKGPDGQV